MDNISYSFTKNADASIIQDANEFADYLTKKIGLKFFATCSNGILTIRPGKPHSYTPTKEEVEDFKAKHPEYAFMKGVKHTEPTNVNYTLTSDRIETTSLPSLRITRMLREEPYRRIWNYLVKFKYRFIKLSTVAKRCNTIISQEYDEFLLLLQDNHIIEYDNNKVKLTSEALKKIPAKLFNQAELDKEYIEEVKLKAKAKL